MAIKDQNTIQGCFNPRICKRCDTANIQLLHSIIVSIHASVKDATYKRPTDSNGWQVSIHASVKDATIFQDHLLLPQ